MSKITIEMDENEFSALLEGAEFGLRLKEDYFEQQINNVFGRTKHKEDLRFNYKEIKRKTKRQRDDLLMMKERIRKDLSKEEYMKTLKELEDLGVDIGEIMNVIIKSIKR